MRLIQVIQTIKLTHSRRSVLVVAKLFGLAVRIVALLDELIPLLEILKGTHQLLHLPG
jgi:hypothetical protein